MKARTLKITFFVCLGMLITTGLFAQPAGFQPHGNNSGGAADPTEAIDSVTVGSSIRYVVEPDATLNGSYDFATMTGTLSSSFAWTIDAAISAGTAETDNDVTITMAGSAGTGQISVVETSAAPASCVGNTVTIDVEVIAEPTATFDAAASAICQAAIADYTVNITLNTATAGGSIRLGINMDGPSTGGIYTTTLNTTDATTSFTIPAAEFDDGNGDYVITFTEISDHISRKSGVTVSTAGLSHTLTINRTPTTGNIYHVPNQ